MKKWAVLAVFLSSPCVAATTADQLVKQCGGAIAEAAGGVMSPEQRDDSFFCTGYLAGFAEGTSMGEFFNRSGMKYCVGDGVSPHAIMNLLQAALSKNPKSGRNEARMMIYAVLVEAFPCPNK